MSGTKIHHLIALASEPSSARRRELLREVTDLFFTDDGHGHREMGLFDDVLTQLAGEMEEVVRAELAQRMSGAAHVPSGLVRDLAVDPSLAVAAPMLAHPSLLEADQQHIARNLGEGHLRVLSQRRHRRHRPARR